MNSPDERPDGLINNPEEKNLLDSPPDVPKKRNPQKQSLLSRKGHPRTLNFEERVAVWEKYVKGSNVFGLAVEFETNPAEIEDCINRTAAELGFPHNHVDPELERFRILEASDQIKSALVKCLDESNRILIELNKTRKKIKSDKDLDELEPANLKNYLVLMEARQNEMKQVISIIAEYRTTNTFIANLLGINRTKLKREPKKIATPEELLQGLSEEELQEIVNESSDSE